MLPVLASHPCSMVRPTSVKLGVPIVPVGVGGSEHILPKGAKFPHFHRVAVVVGAPLNPVDVAGGSPPRRDQTHR